jgi:hypothetical protein
LGFLDYAWATTLQKSKSKAAITVEAGLLQSSLEVKDTNYKITLPAPHLIEDDGGYSFLGFNFPAQNAKAEVGKLFRACVTHLTGHTLVPSAEKQPYHRFNRLESFVSAIVDDVFVNAYITKFHPDRLPDIAFANALSYCRMRPTHRILNHSTCIMTALLSQMNLGQIKGQLSREEAHSCNQLTATLTSLKKAILNSTIEDDDITDTLCEAKNDVAEAIEPYGPITESPSLPYTEKTGPCTVFTQSDTLPPEDEVEKLFKDSLTALGSDPSDVSSMNACWSKETDVAVSQAFDSQIHQQLREEKALTKLSRFMEGTRLKSVEFPPENYTQYLRARSLLRGGSRRLLDSLRVAQDALDEDPRKEMGQLDITEVIQKVASNSPRTDVFMQNEYLSKSFAWSILLDVSASMRINAEGCRALAICVAEATKELLMDPGSWTFYAFSDRLYVLKDASEAYSKRVRARIGGLQFSGLTYMPDALHVAGSMVAQRFDEQRFLIVMSDGWPYGYPDVARELSERIDALEKRGVITIGVGLESERIQEHFRINCTVHSQKDLIKQFSKIYLKASQAALET